MTYRLYSAGAFHRLSMVVPLAADSLPLQRTVNNGPVNNAPSLPHLSSPPQDYGPPWPLHRRLQGKDAVPT